MAETTYIEWGKATIEFIRVVAWPSAVVSLALIFKSPLTKFLTSLRGLELEGGGFKAKVDAAEAEQQQGAKNPFGPESSESILELDASRQLSDEKPKKPESSPVMASPRPAVARLENETRNELRAVDSQQREERLIRALAEIRLRAGHEFIYNRIFGSQIVFLKRLNELANCTVDQAHEFFQPFAKQFPQVYSNYSFEAWLNFMVTNALVLRNGDNLMIDEIGRDFLFYIVLQRLLENKPW